MSFITFNQNFVNQANNSHLSSGAPAGNGDGINWPYDPNGSSPDPSQFQINWNDPNALQQAEQAYERLVAWLQNNPGCYNGDIMLLQMTVDIGQHMGSLPADQQRQLGQFLSNQLSASNGGTTLLQMILSMAAEGAAISQPGLQQGIANATQFLQQLANALSGISDIAGYGPLFSNLYYNVLQAQGGIANWCANSWKTFTNPVTGDQSSCWVDSNKMPITSFSEFANEAAYTIGLVLTPSPTNPGAGSIIDAYYQAEIAQLVDQFKGNPWALLVALMNLINQRDTDNGMAVNGYGNNLNVIKQANNLVQQMLGDLAGATPNATDFFAKMQQLQALVCQDPALQNLIPQLQADAETINNQSITPGMIPPTPPSTNPVTSFDWDITAGYYNIPAVLCTTKGDPHNGQEGLYITYTVNGKTTRQWFPAGEDYLPAGHMHIDAADIPNGLTLGQLAGMGGTSEISKVMGSWASTVMSNFENGVTGIQTLLNGASPAIQQQIQNTTQTMQAEENFEKEAFNSIVNVNQQIMKLVQQVMG